MKLDVRSTNTAVLAKCSHMRDRNRNCTIGKLRKSCCRRRCCACACINDLVTVGSGWGGMPDLCDQAKHRGISLLKGIISPVILSSGQSGDKRGFSFSSRPTHSLRPHNWDQTTSIWSVHSFNLKTSSNPFRRLHFCRTKHTIHH